MDIKIKNKLLEYLKGKYSDHSNFRIINNIIYSTTSVSMQTLSGIDSIQKVKAVFYTSLKSKPFDLGFRLGVILYE